MRDHPTVTASTMIAQLDFGRKVRCHNGAWKKWRPRFAFLLDTRLSCI
jgi:hypothetical protein